MQMLLVRRKGQTKNYKKARTPSGQIDQQVTLREVALENRVSDNRLQNKEDSQTGQSRHITEADA